MAFKAVLIGQQNVGKTTIFNLLTSSHNHVGNWHGVTTNVAESKARDGLSVIDLPGVDSLWMIENENPEQKVTHQFIADNFGYDHGSVAKNDICIPIVVGDVTTLKATIDLAKQMISMTSDVILVINKLDRAEKLGIKIDVKKLEQSLGCIVVLLSAVSKKNAKTILYEVIERVIAAKNDAKKHITTRNHLLNQKNMTTDEIFVQSVIINKTNYIKFTDFCDYIFLHRWLGLPMFMLIMVSVFYITLQIGDTLKEQFEIISDIFITNTILAVGGSLNFPEWLINIIYYGIGSGIRTVASFIPLITVLYICMAMLDESGYMTRASLVASKAMSRLGLHGKAIIPLILGFGCNVPAITATGMVGSIKERVISIMMMPFMVCSARFAVFVLLCDIFWPKHATFAISVLYMTGIFLGVITALLSKIIMNVPAKVEYSAKNSVVQLPNYAIPRFRGVIRVVWYRVRQFIYGASKVIIIVSILLYCLSSINVKKMEFVELHDSVLADVGRYAAKFTAPMGIDSDNWEATVSLLSGVMAKEVVIGSIETLYGLSADDHMLKELQAAKTDKRIFAWWVSEVNEHFFGAEAIRFMLNYFGHHEIENELDIVEQQQSGEIQDKAPNQYELSLILKQKFANYGSVFAYLLFILLYFPCISVFTATSREIGRKYAVISGLWTTSLAYCVATVFYQIYQILQPFMQQSNSCLILASLILCMVCISMVAFAIVGCGKKMRLY